MSEVALRQESLAPAVSETTAIISMIERAARDPSVDIDKMERLMLMQERAFERRAEVEYNAAFARMQPELPAVEKNGKSNNGAYGLWEDIQGAIQPVIAKHGFSLSFKPLVEADAVTVTAILRHEAGFKDTAEIRLPVDKSGSKNVVQAVGSSVSYGKRYAACGLLNIRVANEDDDGKAAGGGFITEDQAVELREMIEAAEADETGLKTYFRIEHLKDMLASKFPDAKAMLQRKLDKKGAR